jgi:hypothetical protein
MNSLSLQYIEDFNNYTFGIYKEFHQSCCSMTTSGNFALVQSVDDKKKAFETDKEMTINEFNQYGFLPNLICTSISWIVLIIGAIYSLPFMFLFIVALFAFSIPVNFYYKYRKYRRILATTVESIWSDLWEGAIHFDCVQRNILEIEYNAHYGSDPYPHIHEPEIQIKYIKTICKFEDLIEISETIKSSGGTPGSSPTQTYYLSIKHVHGSDKYKMRDYEMHTKTMDKIKQILNLTNLNTVQIREHRNCNCIC